MQRDTLVEVVYGDTFRPILHYIHSLMLHYPHHHIIIGKYEFLGAYRCLTMWGHSTATSCTTIDDLAFLSLRLTFGCSPCPFLWCPVTEAITEITNDILSCKDWDQFEVHSPLTDKSPQVKYLPDSVPFVKSLPPDVNVPPIKHGKVDGYIEDLISVVLDVDSNP